MFGGVRFHRTAGLDRDISSWVYQHFGEFPNNDIGPGSAAWHGSDLPVVFGTSESAHKMQDTTEEKQLSYNFRTR
jgi:carboxylesterase type B